MSTFSGSSLISKKIKDFISSKPFLLTQTDIANVGNEMNLVGYNPLVGLVSNENKSFSPRLINWVEPYQIGGYTKTLFYTEFNSGISVGDRVFIINGNYDSNELIKKDKYKKGRDGYKVLYVDRCAIVLDIDYTGVQPYQELNDDDFVNVYYIRNSQDFKHANRQITTKNGIFDYKFNPYNNNIIYVDQDYPSSTGWGENGGLTGSPGFYVKNGTYSWTNITSQFISGSFSIALGPSSSIDKIKINNYSFTFSIGPGVAEFKEDFVYKWSMGLEPDAVAGTYSTWIDVSVYNKPIITKGNFRQGNFNGVFNTGVFGQPTKQINWEGASSTWNGGTLLNTKWKQGTFDSKFTLSESYVTEFDEYGTPYQKVSGPNNNGKGYNLIISSELLNSTIVNGTILDTVLGSTPTYSLIENYLTSNLTTYTNQVNKASFENCRFLGGYISNAELKNTRASNTYFDNIKSINSNYKLSIIKNSNYSSDNIIKILGYDEFNYNAFIGPTSSSHKVYKFYISKSSYERLKIRDRFYIKGLKFNDNSNYPLNFFDKRFRFSTWTEYFDDLSSSTYINPYTFYKRGVEVGAFLLTPEDNRYRYNTFISGGNLIVGENSNKNYSIDIVFTNYDKNNTPIGGLDFNYSQEASGTYSLTMSSSLGNIIDTTNAWILDSDFESGLFENSNWNSGYHMNYNNDVNITVDDTVGKYYNITVATPSQSLIVTTKYDNFFVETGEDCLKVGNIVYLNAVDWDTTGRIDSFTISSYGSGYSTNSGLTANGGSGNGVVLDITSISGGLDNINITFGGLGYQVGDTLTVNGGNNDGEIVVLSVTGSVTRLPDTYKITSNISGVLILKEIVTGTSVIESLLDNGLAYTTDAQNRWGYIYKSKFNKSKIKNGIFRRTYLSKSLIENGDYVETDLEFSNLEKIRNLLISDSIFSNNDNILSKATYMNSSFVGYTDTQIGGIIFNSIWNGPTFSNGVFKQGRWVNGVFKNGTFYNSKSFNNSATASYPYFDTERQKSYYKDGLTDLVLSNDRYSWQSGTFVDGKFYKGDWEDGEFKGGQFYFSKFYGGTISGGIIGEDSIPASDTNVYNANISFTTVENATLYAKDTSYYQTTQANINWYDGIFNSGLFGSDMIQLSNNNAIWYGGIFNNGQFISNARWKDGIFNGGKFISGFGWTMSDSNDISDYTWEKGTFNGGEFGNANVATNSTWFQGDFNGGVFKGRVWNNGIFTGGEFHGSGETYSAIGGLSSSNASEFVDSFNSSFYGLWRTGFVSDNKDKFVTQEKIFSKIESMKKFIATKPIYQMKNMLWETGTFSHPRINMVNSVWLDGAFERGKFTDSSFNPYVKRFGNSTPTFNLSDDTCYWENGNFDGGDFYISQFKSGKFIIGTAYGMIFKDGVSNYMNAFNVFWESGLWRNGNWYGSYFQYNGELTDDFSLQIIYRGMSWSGNNSCHIWNIFQDATDNDAKISSSTNSTISGGLVDILEGESLDTSESS